VTHVLLLLGCAVVIYLACEWFVNAIEWLGVELKVGPVAVGSILAAVGTALPESVVTFIAIVFGSADQGKDLGVGAALGGPLVVGTVAYSVTGLMLLRHRRGPITGVDTARLSRDQTSFLGVFAVAFLLGLTAFAVKPLLGWAFFAAYGVYVWQEMTGDPETASHEGLDPLKLQPRAPRPHQLAVWGQTLGALAVIFGASQVFVRQLEWAGPAMGLPPTVVALLLSPIATELPETLNAVIWVRQGKTQLALANIAGAMMVQATVPAGIGLLMTPWRYDAPLMIAAGATVVSVVYVRWLMRSGRATAGRLALTGLCYVGFAVGALAVS
jgi:cation:H+ antiporter